MCLDSNAQTTLEWSPAQGCISFNDSDVEVLNNVVPLEDINPSECVTVCEGTPVDFWINDPNQTLSNIIWTVNGGSMSNNTGNGITSTFMSNVGGPVSVNFEAINQDGERITVSQCVQISFAPKALFELPDNQSTYCAGEIPLINLSTVNGGSAIVSYEWYFAHDNTFSNAENPVHFFPEGNHVISLTVYNECGCSDTYRATYKFTHEQLPVSCPTVVCENAIETYSFPTTENCRVQRWSTNHGTIIGSDSEPLVQVQWDDVPLDGFAVLRLETSNCSCDSDKIIRIPVITKTVEITGSHEVCPDSQFLYKLPQWPTTIFNYTVTDSSGNLVNNAVIRTDQHNEVVFDTSNLAAGFYDLNVQYENTMLQCGGQATKRIEVKEIWTIDGTEVGCVNTDYQFTETSNSGTTRFSAGSKVYSNGVFTGQTDANGFFTFTNPGVYELNNVGNPNECQSNSFHIEIIAAPSSQGLVINGPDEICSDVPISFSVVLPPDTGAFWTITYGTIIGTAQGATVQTLFDSLPNGVTDYEISVQLYALDAPECLGDPVTILVPPLTVDAVIENLTPLPGNNGTFCTSSIASFRTDYTNAERYDWLLSDPTAGSIHLGQGTQSIDVLWNELPPGVPSQTVDLELNIIECNQIVSTIFYSVQLLGVPSLSVSSPSEVCAEDSFSVVVNSTNNLPIDISTATITVTLDGVVQANATATQGINSNQFTVNGLTSLNVDNNQNRDIVITVSSLNGCATTVSAVGTILVKPTPRIFTFVQSGGITFCSPSSINTIIETTTQTGSIGITSYDWYVLGNSTPVQSGTNHVLDIAAISNPTFGSYYVLATGTNGCATQSEFTIIEQDCNSNGSGPGGSGPGTGSGSNSPCGTSVTDLTLTWSDCNIVTATTPAASGVTAFSWRSTGFNEGTLLPGATATQAQFQVDGIGPLQIFVTHDYSNCTDSNSERITIEYLPQLDIEAVCNGTDFTVDLFNNSPHLVGNYPNDVTYEYSANNGATWTAISTSSQNALSATINQLPPADYLFRMRISSLPDSPVCEDIQSLSLQLPTGDFNILDKNGNPVTETCAECPVTLEINAVNPAFQYEWSWSGIRNLAENPSIILANSTQSILLKITDTYGCSTTVSKNIIVHQADFDGEVITTGTYCPGSPDLEISFNDNSIFSTPYNYQWLLNGSPAPGTNDQATYTVAQSGVYSLELQDQNDCTQLIDGINMFVNTPPYAQIKMDDKVCVNSLFDIMGYTQLPTAQQALQYRWGINQAFTTWITVPSNGRMEYGGIITTVGQALISLEVRDPAGCETRVTKTIEVLPEPTWNFVTALLDDCDKYTVILYAQASVSGNYYWSNGETTSNTIVNHGGPYTVRFVPDGGGCPIERTITVPKHPNEFLWVFPSGCAQYCEDDIRDRYLIGPLGPQFNYEWQLDQQVMDTDFLNHVRPYALNSGSGNIQFQLTTGELNPPEEWCTAVSKPLSLKIIEDCTGCEIDFNMRELQRVEQPYLHYYLDTVIFNAYSTPINIELYPLGNTGIIHPSTISVPANASINVILEFIPNGNFTGSSIAIAAAVQDVDFNCFSVFEVDLGEEEARKSNLVIVPNPAKDVVQLSLRHKMEHKTATTLVIYNMMGIVSYSQKINNASEPIEVDISNWIPGNYIATLNYKNGSFEQEILIKK